MILLAAILAARAACHRPAPRLLGCSAASGPEPIAADLRAHASRVSRTAADAGSRRSPASPSRRRSAFAAIVALVLGGVVASPFPFFILGPAGAGHHAGLSWPRHCRLHAGLAPPHAGTAIRPARPSRTIRRYACSSARVSSRSASEDFPHDIEKRTAAHRHRRPGRLRQDDADRKALQGDARRVLDRRRHQRHLHQGRRHDAGAAAGAAGGPHHGRRDRRLPAHGDPRGRLDQPAGDRRDEQRHSRISTSSSSNPAATISPRPSRPTSPTSRSTSSRSARARRSRARAGRASRAPTSWSSTRATSRPM